jgi:hypothetical protein
MISDWGSFGQFEYGGDSVGVYEEERILVFKNVIKPHLLVSWSLTTAAVLEAKGKSVCAYPKNPREKIALDEGFGRKYKIVDGRALLEEFPEVWLSYSFLPEALSPILSESLICSPYSRSAVSAKSYSGNDYHGAHRDTNPVTALLYLTEGQPTVIFKKDGSVFQPVCQPGTMIVFAGRELLHQVPANHKQSRRVIAFNLYTSSDIWRPAGTDSLVYGE